MLACRAVALAVLVLLSLACSASARAQVLAKRPPRRPVQVVKVVEERGFSWRDAGIGAAAAGLCVSVIAAGGLVHVRAHQPRAPVERASCERRESVG